MWLLLPPLVTSSKDGMMLALQDMYIEQVYQGITLAPTKDVFTLALGKDDHYGRVRIVGFGVSKKSYFGAAKPKDSASKQEVLALKNEIVKLKQQMVCD